MRIKLLVSLFLLFALWLGISVSVAQNDRTLVPDEPVTDTLDETNSAQIYTFSAASGGSATLTLTPEDDLSAALVLSDTAGNTLDQVTSTPDAESVTLESVSIPESGTYYVTVFPAPGTTTTTGTFELTLTLEGASAATPAPVTPTATETVSPESFNVSQVVLTNGIEVNLTWQTNDDLNLQIRDPAGGTLFWDSRSTVDGGSFGPDVNGLCETISEPPNTETATWPGGSLPTGSYEILVYYRQACEEAQPADFEVEINVDGVALEPISDTIQPPQNNTSTVFISNFEVKEDGTASLGRSGPYTSTEVLPIPAQDIVAEDARPITPDTPTQGVITNDQWYETYQFDGEAGQAVTVEMTANSGNLDTLLLVLNSSGQIIGSNDDIEVAENTNSRIEGLRLPTSDTYTVFASRYGKDVGGTEGTYSLVVSTTDIPQQLETLNLPSGDIEVTLTWDADVDLQLLVRDPSGASVFDDNPTVQSGGQLTETGNANCNISEGPPVYHIYWPDGFLRIGWWEIDVWYQSECNNPGPVNFTLYIVVNDELVTTRTGTVAFRDHYVTSFLIEQDGTSEALEGGVVQGSQDIPYQEQRASAVAISPGSTLTGSITPDNRFDLYTFEGRANDQVTLRMNATASTLDTQLYLIDPTGTEIAANDDIADDNTNSAIGDITLSQDGQYTIIATHYGGIYGGTRGGYNLSLDIER